MREVGMRLLMGRGGEQAEVSLLLLVGVLVADSELAPPETSKRRFSQQTQGVPTSTSVDAEVLDAAESSASEVGNKRSELDSALVSREFAAKGQETILPPKTAPIHCAADDPPIFGRSWVISGTQKQSKSEHQDNADQDINYKASRKPCRDWQGRLEILK